jgi:hypothetical protein
VDDDMPDTAEPDEPAEPVGPVEPTEPVAAAEPAEPVAAAEPGGDTTEPGDATTEPGDAGSEITELKAERDALLAKLDTRERRHRRAERARSIGVVVLVVLAVVCFIAANIGGWARRNLLDTDRFTDTAQELITDPAVKAAVGDRMTQELVKVIDPANIFREVLPSRAQVLAVPLANAVEEFLGDQVDRFVDSEAFEDIWVAVVRLAHSTAVQVLRGENENVQIENGVITINLLPLINAVLSRIEGLVPEIFGRTVNLPEITPDTIPERARERLGNALGINLSDDFGEIKIYDADRVQAAQDALRLFERAVVIIAILTVVFTALALWLSRRRRRTLLQLTIGAIIGIVIVRRLGFWFESNLGTRQDDPVIARAVRSAGDILLDSFFVLTAALLVVLIIVAVVAALTGPYPWAVWLRRRAAGLTGEGNAWLRAQAVDTGPTRWIATNREALQIGALVVAGLVVLFVDLSWVGLLVLVLLVGAFVIVVHQLGRDRPPAEVTPPDSPVPPPDLA